MESIVLIIVTPPVLVPPLERTFSTPSVGAERKLVELPQPIPALLGEVPLQEVLTMNNTLLKQRTEVNTLWMTNRLTFFLCTPQK